MIKKAFYDEPIKKSSRYYRFILGFFKANDVKFRMRWDSVSSGGFAYSDQGYVEIRVTEGSVRQKRPVTIRKFLSVSLHEFCHVLNAREGKYKGYHTMSGRITRARLKMWIRTGVRAEKYTDKRAAKLLAEYFPEIPFFPGYDLSGIKMYKKYHLGAIREDLRIMERRAKKP